jgi:hypothetical protein
MHRAGMAFSQLSRADASGFTLSGTGSATVTTPARYQPRHGYRITIRSGGTVTNAAAVSDEDGRLTVHVPANSGVAVGGEHG